MPKIKSRRQLIADRKRAENKANAVRELQQLADNALRLKTMTGGFSKSPKTSSCGGPNLQQISKKSVLAKKVFVRDTPKYPSLVSVGSSPVKIKPVLSPEMQQRELAAQKEIERKKKRVAILYNKGGYQYVSDATDLTTLGKK